MFRYPLCQTMHGNIVLDGISLKMTKLTTNMVNFVLVASFRENKSLS